MWSEELLKIYTGKHWATLAPYDEVKQCNAKVQWHNQTQILSLTQSVNCKQLCILQKYNANSLP